MNSSITPISNPTNRKAALETKLAELIRVSARREGLDIEYQADPTDEVRAGIDRDVTIDQLNRQAKISREIRSALEKLDSSQYGVCEECEEPISRRRLDAVPWARLCVRCQSRTEEPKVEAKSFDNAA